MGDEPRTTSGAHAGEKLINDSIHGPMIFDPVLVAIMDTPQFQRLRDIKQLGAGYFVYPGASHNRFEHSLGVCHIAGELLDELAKDSSLNIEQKDRLMVQIAGLCHDMGHGPFSHTFDMQFMPAATGKPFEHEELSLKMFDHMLEKNKDIQKELKDLEIDTEIVKHLIHLKGKTPKDLLPGKEFLFEIVANKRNGVDVDKWDYFKRDGTYLGIPTAFDHKRLMKFCKVIAGGDEKQICLRDKEAFNLYEMFITRQTLHRKAYQHKTVKSLETMIVNGLLAANNHIKIKGTNGEGKTIVECTEDMEAFTRLTDSIFHQILASKDPELKTAQEWLEAVQNRQMYRLVAETPPITDKKILDLKNENIQKEIEACIPQEKLTILKENSQPAYASYPGYPKYRFTVQVVNLNYGKKGTNPVDHVLFYTKGGGDKPKSIKAYEISSFLPKDNIAEMYVRVLLRPCPGEVESDRERAKCIYDALHDWYNNKVPDSENQLKFQWPFSWYP